MFLNVVYRTIRRRRKINEHKSYLIFHLTTMVNTHLFQVISNQIMLTNSY